VNRKQLRLHWSLCPGRQWRWLASRGAVARTTLTVKLGGYTCSPQIRARYATPTDRPVRDDSKPTNQSPQDRDRIPLNPLACQVASYGIKDMHSTCRGRRKLAQRVHWARRDPAWVGCVAICPSRTDCLSPVQSQTRTFRLGPRYPARLFSDPQAARKKALRSPPGFLLKLLVS